ncbi:DUF4133 domain-containing protein [Fibrella sp. HMF5335]|uniref:DUF4133 domain-containing protein n=1 Tax=Fibrella rubiginis TaxID=2817060 RepID=A0A939GFS4_9BACT|nr:DUF4133 domain-containing protein [Fibrella rubiginis]MBO0936434.1 DUF4133 domain-containing protein [Fibrella rubiginis]
MFRVNKGVDRPPEVLGIRGMNFIKGIGLTAIGLLVLTMIVMAIADIPAKIGFSAYFGSLFAAYTLMTRISKQYGERGFIKQRSRERQPKVVLVRDSAVYRQLRNRTTRKG